MANNLIKKGTTLDVSKDKVGSTHVDDSVKEYVTTQTSGTVAHGSSITTFKTVKSTIALFNLPQFVEKVEQTKKPLINF